jgi:tetratricopeptide (TPR) repeat protein
MNDIEIENLIKESLKKAFECYTCGDYSQAEELYRQILRVDRHNMDALEIGSLTICQNGKPDEAKEWAVKALSRDHNNFKLYNNLGLIHGSLKEHDQAIRCFKIAINKEPSEAFLYSNLAIQHKSRGQLEEACKVIEEAIDKGNESDHLYFNYGAIVHEFGMYKKAINLYKKAIKINPEMAISHYNLSACQLLLGDYENGWKEYEWRWKQFEKFATIRNKFSKPYYEGQSLKNKTIVLYCEQGIGDAIMMSRYIPTLKNMGARIVLETTLTELFEQFNI